jgi:3-oxoacyl-[acyl-carrier protein] reductase
MAEDAAACLRDAALAALGKVDILVNNAGGSRVMPIDAPEERWTEAMTLNFTRQRQIAHALLPQMIERRWGRIINITSIAGITGNRGQSNYAAAKGALHAATKSLALELASRGITVNAVAPGIIVTGMIEGAFNAETIKKLVPMQRAGQPEEVADLVAFLASDQAAYISGQVISINGAMI